MKIRTRLTVLFTIISAAILLAFAFVIYYSAKENREKEFYTSLKKEGITKANLIFDAKVDAKTLQDIYRTNRKLLNEVEVAIYDSTFQMIYHDAVELDMVKETPEMINEIVQKNELEFYVEDWQVIGMRYAFDGKNYIITAAAFDRYGYNKLESLYRTIVMVFIISILFVYGAGRYFSKKAFEPVLEMTEKAQHISALNLGLRLTVNINKDELSSLAFTFNEMLDRLEKSFESQKNFVSNISHEIRTPLAAIITELELSITKERSVEAYKTAIVNALSDARKLARLSTSLLDFAKASYDPSEIAFKPTRIDEVLLDACLQVQKSNPSYKIDIHFENNFESDEEISIYGNEYLLKTAFVNLFENGCKFSTNNQSAVAISFYKNELQLVFKDQGIGIAPSDLDAIFLPFYRGDNKNFADGNGIGLSLTKKIIELHKGTITVDSEVSKGTTFTLKLTNTSPL